MILHVVIKWSLLANLFVLIQVLVIIQVLHVLFKCYYLHNTMHAMYPVLFYFIFCYYLLVFDHILWSYFFNNWDWIWHLCQAVCIISHPVSNLTLKAPIDPIHQFTPLNNRNWLPTVTFHSLFTVLPVFIHNLLYCSKHMIISFILKKMCPWPQIFIKSFHFW